MTGNQVIVTMLGEVNAQRRANRNHLPTMPERAHPDARPSSRDRSALLAVIATLACAYGFRDMGVLGADCRLWPWGRVDNSPVTSHNLIA